CADLIAAYRCDCNAGYGGKNCSIDIDECESSPCTRTCQDKINSFSCNCEAGFTGARCDVDIDDCLQSPCRNGTCVDLVNNYTCNCNVGFTGANCELVIKTCTEDSCFPNVTCFTSSYTISCGPCPSGFTGDGKNCKDTDDCVNHTSANGGLCVDVGYGHCRLLYLWLSFVNSWGCYFTFMALHVVVFSLTCPINLTMLFLTVSSPSLSSGTSAVPSLQLPSKSEITTATESFSVRPSSIIPGSTFTQKPETEHVFKMKILQDWNDELKDTESTTFKALSVRLETEIMKALSSRKYLIGVKVISFSKGSVVAEFQLMFRSKVSSDEAFADLKNQISDGNLGNLPVDPASLE
ncbi:unnamed protein product, partial [Porites evermanni]